MIIGTVRLMLIRNNENLTIVREYGKGIHFYVLVVRSPPQEIVT